NFMVCQMDADIQPCFERRFKPGSREMPNESKRRSDEFLNPNDEGISRNDGCLSPNEEGMTNAKARKTNVPPNACPSESEQIRPSYFWLPSSFGFRNSSFLLKARFDRENPYRFKENSCNVSLIVV